MAFTVGMVRNLCEEKKCVRSAEVLSSGESATEAETVHGRVLCLHGYRTSSAVLRQQMVALSAVLERAGYGPFVVPNGPYKSKGAAQFAEGLDEEDSYGWWQYPDDVAKDAPPIGLSESLESYACRHRSIPHEMRAAWRIEGLRLLGVLPATATGPIGAEFMAAWVTRGICAIAPGVTVPTKAVTEFDD